MPMTFNEFLKKIGGNYFINEDINRKKKLFFKYKNGNSKVIADSYPNITGVEFIGFNDINYKYYVCYKGKNLKNSDTTCTVLISAGRNHRIEILDIDSVRELLYEDIYINGNEETLFNLFKKYFKEVLVADLRERTKRLFRYGWNKEDENNIDNSWGFIGITCMGRWKPITNSISKKDTEELLFNGMSIDKEKQLSPKRSEHCQRDNGIKEKSPANIIIQTERFKLFFNLVLANKNIMGIFAYSIHSFLWYYTLREAIGNKEKLNKQSELHNEFNDVFAICIHGKNIQIVNTFANLLSNVFYVDADDISTIYAKNIIPCDRRNPEKAIKYSWQSIPILVTNEKNILTKHSGIVSRIQMQREKRVNYFFPVYLNKRPLKSEEIEDYCVDGLGELLPEEGDMILLKEEINYLMILFIKLLSDMANSEYPGVHRNTIELIYQNTVEEISKKKSFKRNKKNANKLLYAAIKGFCCLLEELGLNKEAKLMINHAYQFIIDDSSTQLNEKENVNTVEDKSLELFKEYIMEIITKDIMKRPDFFCIQNESRGIKEKCIYLIENDFIKYFNQFIKDSVKIDYLTLKKRLAQNRLLKRRNGDTQYNMVRTLDIKGVKVKKASCLVIPVNEFEDLFGRSIDG